ncbi:MAG TPA: lamin tail domain-containing protein [Chloroflexota bacterium]
MIHQVAPANLHDGMRFPFARVLLAAATIAGMALPHAGPALAVSPDVVISQIYGGGGNSGATLTNDFIELHNRGSAAVNLTGWSVQYASAAGASWSVTNLTGSIPSGAHYLVQESAGGGGTTPLPAPDATGSIAMSATSGKVALRTTTTACPAVCVTDAGTRDFVGYGTANEFEGAAAPLLSNTLADLRPDNGADTDNNAADFTPGTPNPRNSLGASLPPPMPGRAALIHDIQGRSHTSPLVGQRVASVPGVVTGLRSNGFYFQDPNPDADLATSEGIFVFTSTAPNGVAVGDALTVNGTVQEFRPANTASNLTSTELGTPAVTVVSHGNPLPAATVIGQGGRLPPTMVIDDDATGDVETSGSFDATTDGIDFYESMEGMRVQINRPVVVGPSNDFNEIPVLADNGANASLRTPRGGILARGDDFNPERIIVDDEILAAAHQPFPKGLNVGDSLGESVIGIVDYGFGNFMVELTTPPTRVNGGLQKEMTDAGIPLNQLKVATFNVENLDPTDPSGKFSALASLIVNNLQAPDLVALEEVQDSNGPTAGDTVNPTLTMNMLIAAIQAVPGPLYQYRQIDPVRDQDGGEPGGNIRVVFMFRTDTGLSFVDRPGGDSTTAVSVVNANTGPQLSFSPGRIMPTDPAFNASRKPLAGEFMYNGQHIVAIANHFNSKGGDDPLFGRFQPPTRSSEVQRHQQAQIVHDFVATILSDDPKANVVVMGDLNDFDFSETLDTLRSGVLVELMDTLLPLRERYTYDFEGNSQSLDHILVSSHLSASTAAEYDIVHVNAEFADQASDHDPQVARFIMPSFDSVCALARRYSSSAEVADRLCDDLKAAKAASGPLQRIRPLTRFGVTLATQTGRALTPQEAATLRRLVSFL